MRRAGIHERRALGGSNLLPGGPPLASDINPNDLRNLPSASLLYSWHRAESGVIVGTTMFAQGGATVAATLSGGDYSLVKSLWIGCDTAGTVGSGATFRWSFHELGGGIQQSLIPASTSPTLLPGTNGVSVAFAAGTLAAANFWNPAVVSWAPLVATGNCTLDNSTVTASTQCIFESVGLNDTRSAVHFAPGILGNQAAMATNVTGLNKKFHLFWVGETKSLAAGVNQLAGWGFTSTTQTAKDVLDWICTGPSVATIGDRWSFQHITDAPATQRYDSVQEDGTTALRPDLAPHVFEAFSDGSTLIVRMDGFQVMTGAWTGTMAVDRFTMGGVKLGGSAATAFFDWRCSDFVQYTQNLADVDAAAVRLALS